MIAIPRFGLQTALLVMFVGCAEQATEPQSPFSCGPSVTVAPDGARVAVNGSLQMMATVVCPLDWTARPPEWSVSDSGLAAISSDGVLRGVGPGSIRVRVQFTNSYGGHAPGQATVHIQ